MPGSVASQAGLQQSMTIMAYSVLTYFHISAHIFQEGPADADARDRLNLVASQAPAGTDAILGLEGLAICSNLLKFAHHH